FQAEDGIRDFHVTGVQTCALPIYRSFHFGSQEHRIIGMISHLGPQLAVATGIALGERLAGKKTCTLVFTGEGGTSQGDFHESLKIGRASGRERAGKAGAARRSREE